MATGINISLVSDVRDFLKGTKDAGAALDDVVVSLEDVAKEGTTTADKLGQDFQDVRNDGTRAAERMEREFEDAFKAVKRDASDASRDVSRSMKTAGDDCVNVVDEVKNEAKQNFAEMASSFAGDMDSAVDLVQGTLAGLASSIPGIGIALGGLGMVAGTMYSEWNENAAKTSARIAQMYDDMRESGDRYLSGEYIHQAISDIISGSADAVISLKEVQEIAQATHLPEGTVLAAAAGDGESLAQVLPRVRAEVDRYKEAINEAKAASDGWADTTMLEESMGIWKYYVKDLEGVTSSIETAAGKADLYNQAARRIRENSPGEEEAQRFRGMGIAIDDATKALNALPTDKTITIAVDTSGVHDQIRRALAGEAFTIPVMAARTGKAVY